jgi:hypothetical protein
MRSPSKDKGVDPIAAQVSLQIASAVDYDRQEQGAHSLVQLGERDIYFIDVF